MTKVSQSQGSGAIRVSTSSSRFQWFAANPSRRFVNQRGPRRTRPLPISASRTPTPTTMPPIRSRARKSHDGGEPKRQRIGNAATQPHLSLQKSTISVPSSFAREMPVRLPRYCTRSRSPPRAGSSTLKKKPTMRARNAWP